MKAILVPAGGGESDDGIFETALAAAMPLGAHLDFFHVQVGPGEAVANMPHADFAIGPGLWSTLDEVWTTAVTRSATARDHVESFCRRHAIPMGYRSGDCKEVSASWSEEEGESLPLLIRRARYSDLVVVGRQRGRDQMPGDLLERLLLQSGRPILVVPSHAAQRLLGTIVVCWKECVEAAHAVTAALPLLRNANRVVVVSVAETDDVRALSAAGELAGRMAWHGINAEAVDVPADRRPPAKALMAAARDYGADLVVMGGYGHNRIREIIFGGCTELFLHSADRAVLLVH